MPGSCGRCLFGVGALVAIFGVVACGHDAARSELNSAAAAQPPSAPAQASSSATPNPTETAPPASQTGGFDGAKAYEHVAKIVSYGPRPPASEGIRHVQDYIREQLKSYGCTVDEDDFHASTPVGDVAMKN